MKAQPHRSSKYHETVCCAGIGRDGKWRRQYPVPFRILNDTQKFKRWDWIEYQCTKPAEDLRAESQKVVPESLKLAGELRKTERASFLNPLVRETFSDANARGESLTILRPLTLELRWSEKSQSELTSERQKHAELAKQMSFFDSTAKPLEPSPVRFTIRWRDQEGRIGNHHCDDWETSSAYLRFLRKYGSKRAMEILREKYEDQYFRSGLVLAFSTHSRRNVTYGTNNQWLLVGLIRLDQDAQGDLLL
ncbi:MAG: hypothetical protein OXR62_11655 [Ahrensia sp.]|nr:hypothetical protein [Ahrensia sp.]